nr:MAG TPA: hypothetical protein [Caudoviricetes sp.]
MEKCLIIKFFIYIALSYFSNNHINQLPFLKLLSHRKTKLNSIPKVPL